MLNLDKSPLDQKSLQNDVAGRQLQFVKNLCKGWAPRGSTNDQPGYGEGTEGRLG